MISDRVDVFKHNILIVDDTLENLKFLSAVLTQHGYEVRQAINGSMALMGATAQPPDLILLDVKMPGIDGYEVCKQLKEIEQTKDIPIIFISAIDDAWDKIKAFQVGGVDYITKPFQVEEAIVRIEHQLALQAAKTQIQKLNAELEARVKERTAQLQAANQELEKEISERKKVERELAREKSHLVAAQQVAHIGSWEYDILTQEIRCSDEIFRIFGLNVREETVTYPKHLYKYIYSEERVLWETIVNEALQTGKPYELEFRIVRPDGEIRWVFAKGQPIFNSKNKVTKLFNTVLDITEQQAALRERKQAEEALSKSEELFRLTFEMAPIGMAIQSLDGKFLQVNQALCEILGYTYEELLYRNWADLTHPDDVTVSRLLNQQLCQGEISDFKIESRYLTKNCQLVYGILKVALVRDSMGKPLHLIGQFMDITDRKRAEEQLLYDALHDSLTGLPNRGLLMEYIDQSLKRIQRHRDYLFAVLFIDLDRFKVINDSLGHLVGDRLLIAIARKLQTIVRSTDMVARLGGDEFIILLDEIKDINDAIKIAERISEELRSPLQLENRRVFMNASIGIAIATPEYHQGGDLLRDADIAMYRAKEKGKARYEIFNRIMYTQAFQQLQLENDLRQALERQEFLVHYQPIVSLTTGKLTGFEALIRWQHPKKGLISPSEFIPIAEETGLIVSLGEWVLQTACQQMSNWQTKFATSLPLKISVNLSGKQLREPNLLEKIDEIIARTGINGENLKLELTESMLMENEEAILNTLSELRKRKIQLSIDDFGTGYSSLSYLHRFPVNTLKIDRSFVSRIGEQGENQEIVETIITLAHQLSVSAIAEGVETPQQIDRLKALACEEAQGYFFSKPLESALAENLIKSDPLWSI
ncbi:MAG TPA: EAL domain-containing protein [Leptolyngbyaceae cyanobacterium]